MRLLAFFMFTLIFSSNTVWAKEEGTQTAKPLIHCGTFVFNNLYEPSMSDGDRPKGFFADVMIEASLRLNVDVKFSEVGSFATGFEELKSNRYDMLCASLGSYAANYDKMLFSTALFYDPIYPYGNAKKDYGHINSRKDLDKPSWRISGMDGELGGIFGPIAFPNAQMHMVSQLAGMGAVMNDMFANKADVILLTKAAAEAYQKTNPGTLKQLLDEPIALYPVRFVFKPDDVKTKMMFDNVFEDMRAEGVIDQLKLKNGIK